VLTLAAGLVNTYSLLSSDVALQGAGEPELLQYCCLGALCDPPEDKWLKAHYCTLAGSLP
jgi:hypothetical protein